MPIRVGIDLVTVQTIVDAIADHGSRYLERVYTTQELADGATAKRTDPRWLAGCFAAKEATIKALRVPTTEPIPWRDIGVQRDETGLSRLTLRGRAATLAESVGVSTLALSISYEQGLASAVVIARLR
jgi:holo-[acyl-carrier protein] synthase